jgi:hypothetical protein
LDRFRHEVEQFKQGSDLDRDLYDALFDYYDQHGAMPYRVRNAKDGTANQWVSNQFAGDLGIDEGVLGAALGGIAGAATTKSPAGASIGSSIGDAMTNEGSCNMTMEGEYCPEHGLMECGGMYEADIGPAATAALQQGQSPTAVHYANVSDKNAVSNANTAADVGKIMTAKIGENRQDDPINSNSAMTGSYYEGKETDVQEGDALLARIKSLALLK